ncbi:MAG: tRNA threonylcarbamoyladenosine dehydratase [Treponema sp.]|jgi:tRNA A37 threonylcarbamoyladenosine dehydratase|nr:tRNA threonylcarbamoyladenosine dehydratase [Treponema sp.]
MKENPIFERLSLLTGKDGLEKLQQTNVLVFGVGGVGSWCAEALVRSALGKICIVDFDKVNESNINRQIQATKKTLGCSKVEVFKERLMEINPDCEIKIRDEPFCRENFQSFNIENYDYVIDAIDSLTHKLDLIETVYGAGVTLYSSMGMALKMHPEQIKTASVWDTKECSLARLVRQGLRKRGFSGDFTVVYSSEPPMAAKGSPRAGEKRANGSLVTVTASAGLLLASLVLRDTLSRL